jgi:hypothetical protein
MNAKTPEWLEMLPWGIVDAFQSSSKSKMDALISDWL